MKVSFNSENIHTYYGCPFHLKIECKNCKMNGGLYHKTNDVYICNNRLTKEEILDRLFHIQEEFNFKISSLIDNINIIGVKDNED